MCHQRACAFHPFPERSGERVLVPRRHLRQARSRERARSCLPPSILKGWRRKRQGALTRQVLKCGARLPQERTPSSNSGGGGERTKPSRRGLLSVCLGGAGRRSVSCRDGGGAAALRCRAAACLPIDERGAPGVTFCVILIGFVWWASFVFFFPSSPLGF